MSDDRQSVTSTETTHYAHFLEHRQRQSWKQTFDVQAPYRWNIRRLSLGRVLDLGCGNGRNLEHLRGNGVGIDHNATFVASCRRRGLEVYPPTEFAREASRLGQFDTLLLSHVAEHLERNDAESLVRVYRPYVRAGGRLAVITPQKRGHASDPTHVVYYNSAEHRRFFTALRASIDQHFSFPFPFWVGDAFTYNETISIGTFAPDD